MKKKSKIQLDFVVDSLTNSIRNIVSGDSFPTAITLFTLNDCRKVTKKNGWNFNWRAEVKDQSNEVYKLTIVGNPDVIQGIISLSREADHIFMNLLENAPFNFGKNKQYEGVAGNLVAYACKISFQLGFDGFVVFTAKTRLIEHYQNSLGAVHIGRQRMFIQTHAAKTLVDKYFKL